MKKSVAKLSLIATLMTSGIWAMAKPMQAQRFERGGALGDGQEIKGRVHASPTSRFYVHVKIDGQIAKVLYNQLTFAYEQQTGHGQGNSRRIIGKHILCKKKTRRSSIRSCEMAIQGRTGNMLPLKISRSPMDSRIMGRKNSRRGKSGDISVVLEPSFELPNTSLFVLKGASAQLLLRKLSSRGGGVRLPSGGLQVAKGSWVCFKNISPTVDHCKAYFDLETTEFLVADEMGTTGTLFLPFYMGMDSDIGGGRDEMDFGGDFSF